VELTQWMELSARQITHETIAMRDSFDTKSETQYSSSSNDAELSQISPHVK
jgi:hypothetical protein